MEDLTKSQETELEDFDLPGNDLDPNTPTPAEQKKIPLVVKVYGFLCLIDGIVTIPTIAMFIGLVAWALNTDPSLITVGTNPTLPVVLLIISLVVTTANAVALIIFGRSLLHNRRRHAARISHALIATTIVQVLLKLMLSGLDTSIITDAVQLVIVITLSITVDPTLREERKLQRNLRDMVDRQAAEVGMLGRDIEGKGFIELNFFNLFWVFVVCCFLGLIIETIYHMVVVEPGVYQDRAGLLFGPFSPIYGFGALLMTVALNRFYKANPIIIFVVSAIIGGLFEAATAWFMQVGFGATAWGLQRLHDLRPLPRPHRRDLRRPHEHPLHVHVGCARFRMDQALPAASLEAHQSHPVEAPLLAHHALRPAHAGERHHDAAGARLLVRATVWHCGRHARRGVLRQELR